MSYVHSFHSDQCRREKRCEKLAPVRPEGSTWEEINTDPPETPVFGRNDQCYLNGNWDSKPHPAFVSGYEDLSNSEFEQHYHQNLKRAIERGDSFIMADNPEKASLEQKTLNFLAVYEVPKDSIMLYRAVGHPHSPDSTFEDRQPSGPSESQTTADGYKLTRVSGTAADRDAAMTEACHYNLLWLRPGDPVWGMSMSAGDVAIADIGVGPGANARRLEQRGILRTMRYYDTIV